MQSWSVIKLKRDVMKEFPQLKEKRESIGYMMVIPKSHEKVKKEISEVKNGAVPILLFFNKERREEN